MVMSDDASAYADLRYTAYRVWKPLKHLKRKAWGHWWV